MAVPGVFHVQGTVFGAGRVAVGVIADFLKGAFIPWVIRDEDFGEMEFILKEAVNLNRIKSGITQESVRVKIRVKGKETGEDRL